MHLDNIPACIAGCNVLTRPPNISGAPVISDTSLTTKPLSLNIFAVPPLATKLNPKSLNLLPNVMRPVLSDTLSNTKN